MKKLGIIFCLLWASLFYCCTLAQNVLKPSLAQLHWQEQERIMFVHFGMATWQGSEGDNWTTPLNQVNPTDLNTDQWCEVAQSWGAKMVLFVAKHVGGFCWWQTDTSDYGVRQIPWRDGKGDVLESLSASCRKYNLDLGVYIYPGDEHWGAMVGSGGITSDPSKQEAYTQIFRRQLTEVLTRYGNISEVWFDGSCKIPVDDILEKYAANSVIFQGPSANIRWVGNEDGIAPDPNWYTLKKEDLKTGTSTALHSTVNGDAYAPVEVDVPFLKNGGHKWFWAPQSDSLLMTKTQLMNLYYRSVGHGAVLLLNSTPDTTGLIPDSHVKIYKMFGDEINRRFANPISQVSGDGDCLIIRFDQPTYVNHSVICEQIAEGQRVLSYEVEGLNSNGEWGMLCQGNSVGTKKIDVFPTTQVCAMRLRINSSLKTPLISNWSLYRIDEESLQMLSQTEHHNFTVLVDSKSATDAKWHTYTFNLTPYMQQVGTYELIFTPSPEWTFKNANLEMYGKNCSSSIERIGDGNIFRLTKSQQTDVQYPVNFSIKAKHTGKMHEQLEVRLKQINYQ
jgi:alpha-L-fucosidase